MVIYTLSLSVISFSGWTSLFSSPLQLLSNPFHKHVFHISVLTSCLYCNVSANAFSPQIRKARGRERLGMRARKH